MIASSTLGLDLRRLLRHWRGVCAARRSQWTGSTEGDRPRVRVNKRLLLGQVICSALIACGGGGGGGGAPPDTTPPTISAASQPDGASNVPVGSVISVTFSEAVAVGSVTTANFTVSGPAGLIAGTVLVNGSVATFTPSAKLLPNTSYTVRLSGATDLAGNALATALTSTFATAPPDTTAPTATGIVPSDGRTGVATNSAIWIDFSEEMAASSITSANFLVSGPGGGIAGLVAVSGAVAKFTPSANLAGNATYIVTLTGGTDLAGNALAASVTSTFTTAATLDTVAPSVVSVSPGNGASGVAPLTPVVVTFSEAIRSAGIFTVSVVGAGQVPGVVSISGAVVTFTPSVVLFPTATHAVHLEGATDLAGNPLPAASSVNTTYAVASPADVVRPDVANVTPASGASGVAIGTPIVVRFSEPMAGGSITAANFTLSGPSGAVPGVVAVNGATATFTPNASLVYGASYIVSLTGATDLAGNLQRSALNWTFSTVAQDLTPPIVFSVSPANGGTGVAINNAIRIAYSESLASGSVTGTNFTLSGPGGTVPGVVSVSGSVATFTPTANLAYSTLYTVRLSGATDPAGNVQANTHTSTFNTATAPDIAPPTVVSISPSNSATGIAVYSPIAVTFSEAVVGASITSANFTLSGPAGAVASTISVNGAVATFTPNTFLSSNSTYTVRISGATDLAGNVLATPATSTFTTASPDVIAPTVVSTNPANGAAGIEVRSSISVTFSEPMLSSSITSANFTVTGSNGAVAGIVSVNGAVATFTPSAGLVGSSSYTLLLSGAKDMAGNAHAAPVSAAFTMVVPRFAYVVGRSGTIVSYAINATTGQLRRVGVAADTGFVGFSPLTIHPSGKFAYMLNQSAQTVLTFSVNDRSGALTQVQRLTTVLNARSMTIEPSGQFAYMVGGGLAEAGFVAGYGIDAVTGTLTSLGAPVASMGVSPVGMTFHPSGRFSYIPHFWSGGISTFRVESTTGTLTNLSAGVGLNLAAGFQNSSIDPSGRFFYAAIRLDGGVVCFSVDVTTGGLTRSGVDLPALAVVEFDPSGRFAYGFRRSQSAPGAPTVNSVEAFRFDAATGTLTNIGTNLPVDNSDLRMIAVDASGRFVQVIGEAAAEISSFAIDVTTGGLSRLVPLPAFGVTAIALSKGAAPVRYIPKFAYVPNVTSNDVSAYGINPTSGALTILGTPVAAGTGPTSIVLDSSGRFAYVANAGSGGVSGFGVDAATGALTSLGAPVPGRAGGVSIGINPPGNIVVVAHQEQDALSYYLRDSATGLLGLPSVSQLAGGSRPSWVGFNEVSGGALGQYVALSGSNVISINAIGANLPVATGSTPVSVTMLPVFPFAYAVNLGSNDISAYRVSGNGSLISLGNVIPAGMGPRSLAIDPSLRFAYVANSISNDVSAYRIDTATGALTSVGATVPTGLNPCCVSVDISGKFAYVVNSGSNDISIYGINPTTGALTSLGTTVSTGSGPRGIVTTGTYE